MCCAVWTESQCLCMIVQDAMHTALPHEPCHLPMLTADASCSPLKGILFWRWDGVTAAVQDSSVGDNALNVATSSDVFQVGLHNPSIVLSFTCMSLPCTTH